jgi:hypothetical protein
VILGSREIDVATFSRWFWVHTVIVPLAIVALLIALAMRARRRRSIDPAGGELSRT